MQEKVKRWGGFIVIFMFGLALGYGVGFSAGAFKSLDWAAGKALYFLELKGIKIDMNSEEIAHAFQQYQMQIDSCYNETNKFNSIELKGGAL